MAHVGAGGLEISHFFTPSFFVRKGADQAIYVDEKIQKKNYKYPKLSLFHVVKYILFLLAIYYFISKIHFQLSNKPFTYFTFYVMLLDGWFRSALTIGPPQVKCQLLISSSIFDAMNFQLFWELL